MSKLFVLFGMYGAGKTTFAKKLAKKENAKHIDIDKYYKKHKREYGNNAYEVWRDVFDDIRECEKKGENCIVDAAHLKKRYRDIYPDWFRHFDKKILYQICNSFENCVKNNKVRKRTIEYDKMVKGWEELEEMSDNENEYYDIKEKWYIGQKKKNETLIRW